MSTKEQQINYIENYLIPKIIEDFNDEILISNNIDVSDGLDGFMSSIYKIHIRTKDKGNVEHDHHIIVKCMKGDEQFRLNSKLYTQFANEIFIYSKVLPYYNEITSKSNTSIQVDEWVPHVYFAKYGKIEGLDSSSPECVLALKNLQPEGYRCGPRLCLDRQHLFLMMKPIAEYHSLTYVMRLKNDKHLDEFVNEIIPLPWTTTSQNADDIKMNLYYPVYRAAFDRFLLYFDKVKDTLNHDDNDDVELMRNIEKLRKYQNDPTKLLEKYREDDNLFSVILHGDYNRNNVLFKYDNKETFDNPRDIKMIDFQELRYATPAIDLSFFMYMNVDPKIRDQIWMELLHYYHEILIRSLMDILKVDAEDEILKPYSFNQFYKHFTKFGFYGAMVCMHFLPWMYCSENECEKLSNLFATDMNSDEFYRLSIEAGGDQANEIIMNIVKHASRMGYMDSI